MTRRRPVERPKEARTIEWEITVVLIVAVLNEFEQVQKALRKACVAEVALNDRDAQTKYYVRQDNVLLGIVLAKLPYPSQGGDAAGFITARLAERYRPYFLTMVGICAGDPQRLDFRDVVISSATVRHDYGKLLLFKDADKKDAYRLEHRHKHLAIKEPLARDILSFLSTYRPRHFTAHLGVISTGNQVTKVPGAFKYLNAALMKQAAGDEYERRLLALEMEAHAVAYACDRCEVPLWLVIKGVADFANRRKNDEHHKPAVKNAYNVAIDLIKEVIVRRFVLERSPIALEAQESATSAYRSGDILSAAESARLAYEAGSRSKSTRRRFIQGLTQRGDYWTAEELVKEHKLVMYDDITREYEASMLWRRGRYREACDALPDSAIGEHRQLLYYRGMSELLDYETRNARTSRKEPRALHMKRVRSFLEHALSVSGGKKRWWILVNYYCVLRLQKAKTNDVATTFERSSQALTEHINSFPASGIPRLYQLMLLALANRRHEFDAVYAQQTNLKHVQLPLENADMVYVRLMLFQKHDLLPDAHFYWARICEWLRRVRTTGRTARQETENVLV